MWLNSFYQFYISAWIIPSLIETICILSLTKKIFYNSCAFATSGDLYKILPLFHLITLYSYTCFLLCALDSFSHLDKISRLLSPSIYYGDCYSVEVILSLIYATLRALKWWGKGFNMSVLKNSVLLRNRKAENRPLMKEICSLPLFAPCLSALMISYCEYFLINVKLRLAGIF